MNRTGHLEADFLQSNDIANYACGSPVFMDDVRREERPINVHKDVRVLDELFATSLFPRRFGKSTQEQAN